ncbi:MAG: MerR family transcriptional regulator [Akkermansiaceae bacterium]|nr:MerR family transcriptional regulator [Akkermansiaceae bacterium]MDP4646510.1 MerR family transcriptional regulator [Akkermansiaceae bacterium]MDP4722142.1 MerR family transcriptional regulator [Akkermansiaceae bacterium]MDP4779329.1 MerR family transcriptional regulator [Akkermansiaceae bacterium]MDP4848106.1 MerR family transcriptional regulator [Akkermansiaceae bacterium]
MKMVEPDPHELHSLEVVIRMTGASRRKIIFYCRKGVLCPTRRDDEWHFDEESVMRLRHIEALRQQHRMNWAAIRTIMGLLDEVEVLREELRFRR